jgi:hypothetical protein
MHVETEHARGASGWLHSIVVRFKRRRHTSNPCRLANG